MPNLNQSIRHLTLPSRMRRLPISPTGFPIPWFVAWIDGVADFRIADAGKFERAIRSDLCWLCGEPNGQFKAFTIGPMCCVNRVTADPPAHRECAEYAVRACPFLARPRMRRNEVDKPAGAFNPGGFMITRNPGCCAIWITKSFKVFRPDGGGRLFRIGPPLSLSFYAEGRAATRDEVMRSIETGMPTLRKLAEQQGREAMLALEHERDAFMKLVDDLCDLKEEAEQRA